LTRGQEVTVEVDHSRRRVITLRPGEMSLHPPPRWGRVGVGVMRAKPTNRFGGVQQLGGKPL
jgi:hypothetical protein